MEKKIWCLFSVDNNYDQPDNNLAGWFTNKPTIEDLFKHFGVDLKDSTLVVLVVSLYAGTTVRIGNTDYRLQEITEGFII